MPTSLRRRLRLARRGLWYVTAVTLVLLALVAGVVSQLLPLAERHPDRIAEWLSARAGRTVRFDRVETEWTRRGPLLRLDGLRVGDGDRAVPIGEAEILVSQYAGLLPGRSFTELRLRNLALTLERGASGRWQVRGLPGQTQSGDPLSALEGLGELQVIDARLGISAPTLGIETTIPEIDLRLRVDGPRVRTGVRAAMRRDGAPVDVVLDFDRKRGDGRVYAAARNADLSEWSALLGAMGVHVTGGRGRAEAWATLRAHQVASISVDGDLSDVRLRGAAIADRAGNAPIAPVARFARLRTLAHWRATPDGWRFDAPTLRVGTTGDDRDATQRLDGLMLAGGTRYGIVADRIDAGPLVAVLALSDRLDPGLRRWLGAARPGAVVEDVRIGGVRGGALRADADLRELHFASVGNTPGVSGLAGRLHGDGDAYALRFDPASRLDFAWPTGFGAPHRVRLRGDVIGWREGAGWRVETGALRIDGEGYGADVRGGVWFQGDGTRPVIDVAADLDDARVPVAKKFWPHFVMSPALVSWLDNALIGGTVANGRAVVAGDLDDWPFKSHDGQAPKGVFDARATLRGAEIHFQSDWPNATGMDADVAFIGNGFNVVGKAALLGVGVSGFSAGIADYGEGMLAIDAKADADAGQLLALLRRSPLQREHGPTLAKLGASGPASANFALRLPLHHPPGETPRAKIDGEIQLRGVRLSESEWKLAFNGIQGSARYDQDGFHAEAMRAQYDRQEGKLSLRAGPGHVRDRAQGFEAELEASMTTDDLLARAPDLAWLKPHVGGRSRWTASIAIPKSAAIPKNAAPAGATPASARGPSAVSRLQLRSDLVGSALRLPAPLDKPAGTPLTTTIGLDLPLGKGDITVAFGQRLALRARDERGQLGIRAVFGSDRVADAPPPSGLVLSGRTPTLDAIDWVALLRGGKSGEGLALRRVDVGVDRLRMLGADFPETRLQVVPTNDGDLAVQLDGPSLAGAVLVPDSDGAAIAGRLQRLHWRAPSAPAGTAPTTANAVANGGGEIDPSKVPPLNLHVDDLRIGDAAFGDTQYRSHPTVNGMEITQLQTRAAKRRLDLTGEWSGRGASSRTRLSATLGSEDFGALLNDLGAGRRISGGKGQARFDVAWPGSPMTFRLGDLDGSLVIDMKDGQLVEVEPGGTGRVIGLLSLAQLPRRLTLDFRDFFSKGFAFNKLGGTVRFGAGAARSDDLAIDGPAAQIRIRGAANLRAQTFDQTIEVQPKAGNLLTAVGALAGGPVGAAVGAVANAVLQKPIGQMTAKHYRVTGPWSAPKVEVVGKPANGRDPETSVEADARPRNGAGAVRAPTGADQSG